MSIATTEHDTRSTFTMTEKEENLFLRFGGVNPKFSKHTHDMKLIRAIKQSSAKRKERAEWLKVIRFLGNHPEFNSITFGDIRLYLRLGKPSWRIFMFTKMLISLSLVFIPVILILCGALTLAYCILHLTS